jgi:hypothetical protein
MLLLKTIVLLGALQGFIVSWLLRASGRFRPEERVSRRLLAALIFWIALACLNLYLIHEPFWTATLTGNILAAIIPLIVVMPIGPLIYFYVRSCEEPDFRLTRRRRRQFVPVVIDLFQHAFLLLFLIALIVRLVPPNKYPVGTWEDYYDQYADIPRWISLTIYLRLASRYLGRRRKAIIPADSEDRAAADSGDRSPADSEDSRRMSWLRTLLRVFWAFDLIWLAHLIPYELPLIHSNGRHHLFPRCQGLFYEYRAPKADRAEPARQETRAAIHPQRKDGSPDRDSPQIDGRRPDLAGYRPQPG